MSPLRSRVRPPFRYSDRQCSFGAKAAPRSRIVVATQPRGWCIRLERPHRADRSARVGDVGGGWGLIPRWGRSSRAAPPSGPAPSAWQSGGERTPTCRAPSGVVPERQLPCRARVPPHATLPGRGAPGVQLRGRDLATRRGPLSSARLPAHGPARGPSADVPYSNRTPTARGSGRGPSASPNRGTECIACIVSNDASNVCFGW